MNWREFDDRYPKARPRAFLYAVSGDADAFRDDVIARIRLRHRPSDLDYQRAEVRDEAQALALLTVEPVGSYRLVELYDFEEWKHRDFLSEWLESRTQPSIIPIFVSRARSPSTDNRFAQHIIRNGWWVVCRKPDRDSMVLYVRERFRVSEAVSLAIIDAVGTDLARIKSLITKLTYMTDGREPKLKDVEEAAMGYVSTIFAVADHILARRVARAMALIDADSTPGILTLMRKRLKELVVVRQLDQRGEPATVIADKAGVPLFLVGGLIERSKSISFDQAARALSIVARAEVDITARGFDAGTVLRRVVLEM